MILNTIDYGFKPVLDLDRLSFKFKYRLWIYTWNEIEQSNSKNSKKRNIFVVYAKHFVMLTKSILFDFSLKRYTQAIWLPDKSYILYTIVRERKKKYIRMTMNNLNVYCKHTVFMFFFVCCIMFITICMHLH